MPETPTTQELVVTNYVYETFGGTGFSNYEYNGNTYWTFANEPYQRWVDVDTDGFWDYGLMDVGDGEWLTFDGFVWRDRNGEVPEIVEPEGRGANDSGYSHVVDMGTLPLEHGADGWLF